MTAQGKTEAFVLGPEFDSYGKVISAIQKAQTSTISVPELSKLLGVKATTLNARFRRERKTTKTVGRTNFIPLELALNLAALHKYALLGWPTLQQASHFTGVKTGTIKARCEKGRLEGHMDLTKRLRINPAELTNLQLHTAAEAPSQLQRRLVRRVRTGGRAPKKQYPLTETCVELPTRKSPSFVLPPAPEPHISVITADDYGLLEVEPGHEGPVGKAAVRGPNKKPSGSGWLSYEPDRPFSICECAVGQLIRYGHYDGRIVKIFDDPFSPKILAHFPEHEHPLMREVLLVVEKSRL
jgi:hypothetical protein